MINACHFGLLSSDKGGWGTCVAWLHAFFVLYVAMVLPVTGQHLTLYLNVLLVVQMIGTGTCLLATRVLGAPACRWERA